MKKYLEVGMITFKAQMAYRFEVFTGVLLSFARIMLAYLLWSVIYRGRNEVAGFTFGMMMTYYIIIAFLKRLDSSEGMVWQLSSEIREGQFTKYLIRPVKPLGYFMAFCYSKTVFIFGINLAATFVYALIFNKYFMLQGRAVIFAGSCIIVLLGLNFLLLLNYFISILSFKFNDVGAFIMIKGNIFDFLTGVLIPLALLPSWLQYGMKFFPFYHIYYLPAMLFMGKETDKLLFGVLMLLLWNTIMFLIVTASYRILKKNYEGVGI